MHPISGVSLHLFLSLRPLKIQSSYLISLKCSKMHSTSRKLQYIRYRYSNMIQNRNYILKTDVIFTLHIFFYPRKIPLVFFVFLKQIHIQMVIVVRGLIVLGKIRCLMNLLYIITEAKVFMKVTMSVHHGWPLSFSLSGD